MALLLFSDVSCRLFMHLTDLEIQWAIKAVILSNQKQRRCLNFTSKL